LEQVGDFGQPLGESYSPQGCPILPPLAPRERASDLTSGDEPARYMRNVALVYWAAGSSYDESGYGCDPNHIAIPRKAPQRRRCRTGLIAALNSDSIRACKADSRPGAWGMGPGGAAGRPREFFDRIIAECGCL
jgi:hypothetical protein